MVGPRGSLTASGLFPLFKMPDGRCTRLELTGEGSKAPAGKGPKTSNATVGGKSDSDLRRSHETSPRGRTGGMSETARVWTE